MTVRALHHYEEAGLLAAAERTSGEHRLYDEAGVERLYRIRVLRGLGLSLAEIRQALDSGAALADMLRAHLARVEEDVERMTHLRDRLRSITDADAQISTDDVLATLEAVSRVERHAHTRKRARTTTDNEVESRWQTVGNMLRACMEAGADPSSQRAKAAAS